MSSPFVGGTYGYNDRATVSSPRLGPRAEPSQGPEDVSVRSMRRERLSTGLMILKIENLTKFLVKVLYTFDDQNKTNCLARWPQALDIRSVFLDESTQIGVVELKICIQAIVSASPELVAKLGQDYTVYAYDYSEYDTPLVGQGMLSWVLASPSASAAPANSARTFVTGRVCRNILGLFSSSSQETLEVKLRLVPVPSCLQSEYIESMKTYRDLSKMMPEGFDAGAWTSFLQANPSVGQLAQNRRQAATTRLGQQTLAELEHMPRLGSQGSSRRGSVELRHIPPTENSSAMEPLQHQPRAASPASSARSATATSRRRGRPPRTASRTSIRGRDTPPITLSNRDTTENTREPDDDRVEDGPVKKRAKVSRVERPDSTGFDKLPDSLRVAASAAASVRIHQPAAVRPAVNKAPSLEGPPRAPTPVADPNNIIRRSQLPKARSNLREQSPVAEEIDYKSPYIGSEYLPRREERNIGSLPNTPAEIPSSPPVYRGPSTAPSSPHLPTLPAHMDSGFMSGAIEGLLEDDEDRTPDDDDLAVAARYSRALELPKPTNEKIDEPLFFTPTSPVAHGIPPDPPNMGHELQPEPVLPETHEKQNAQQPDLDTEATARTGKAVSSASGPRPLERTVSLGNPPSNLPAPSLPNTDPARPVDLYRSQTWSGQHESHPASDTAAVSSNSELSVKPKRRKKGSGVTRKEAIQSKLHTSIEAGEMPPFCENCGAIETPTWRKAWVKVHSGKPDHVHISEEEGGIIAWETLQTDVEGKVCLYRIIKRTLLPLDEGFSEILLCNRKSSQYLPADNANAGPACGLWLHTRKCIRPKEAWEKPQKGPDEKRKRAPRARKPKTDLNSEQMQSDPFLGGNVHSDASSPMDDINTENEHREASQLAQSSRPRASSLEPSSTTTTNTLANHPGEANLPREVQSSPPRLTGAIPTPPEAAELVVKPTRRILFPSPKHAKDQRALGETSLNHNKPSEDVSSKEGHSDCLEYDPSDKENRPPTPNEELHLDDLFEDSHHLLARLSTPSPRTIANPEGFKTPGNPATPDRQLPLTGEFFSSAAKLLFLPTTPSRILSKFQQTAPAGELTPFTLHVSQILSEANNASSLEDDSFDLSTLPPLNLSPSSHPQKEFDLSSFDHQDFLNTDIPIPSSPPWFGVYEDPMEAGNDIWSNFQLPTSPEKRPLPEAEKTQEPVLVKEAIAREASAVLKEGGA